MPWGRAAGVLHRRRTCVHGKHGCVHGWTAVGKSEAEGGCSSGWLASGSSGRGQGKDGGRFHDEEVQQGLMAEQHKEERKMRKEKRKEKKEEWKCKLTGKI